jgi:DNA-binding LacI/PurR family transcriptional regulator
VAQIAEKAKVSPHTVRLYMNTHPDEYEKGYVAVESGHKPVAYRKRKEKKIGRSARR